MVRLSAQGINLAVCWRVSEGVCLWEGPLSHQVTDLGVHTHSRPGLYPPLSTSAGNRIGCIVWYEVEKSPLPHPSTWVLECVLNSAHHNTGCAHSHTHTVTHKHTRSVPSALNIQRETPAGRAIDAFVTGWLFPLGEGGEGWREWAGH